CIAAGGGYLLAGLIPVYVGLVGMSLLPDVTLESTDHFLPTVAKTYLPTVLYVMFVGALVSAILSTVDTALLVSSSLVCHNTLFPLLKIEDEARSEEHTSELQSRENLVCRLLLEKKKEMVIGWDL